MRTTDQAADEVLREGAVGTLRHVTDAAPTSFGTGQAPEVVSGERRRSNVDIRSRASRAAAGLRSLGVSAGDTVALLLRNDFEFYEAVIAAGHAGAYPVPLNWHSTVDEAAYVLADCGAKVVIAHADLLERLRAAIPPGVTTLVVPTPPEIASAYEVQAGPADSAEAHDWHAWLSSFDPVVDPDTSARAAVIYTSGTTGKPKGVRRNPDPNGNAARLATIGYGMADGLETVLMNGPMYHTAPNSYGRLAFERGARIILQPRFDAEEMLQLIERHRVTHMHIVPTMFVRLLRLPAEVRKRHDLSSLRFVIHGAAPCPPELKRAMIDWWGPVIHEYYGATEAGLIASHGSVEAIRKPGTVGRPLPGVAVRIVGDDGHELPAGGVGDIYVHSAASPGFAYIGLTEELQELKLGSFITVGDVGWLDEDGYLFLGARRRDMIISGGVNIYPAEVEAALMRQPDIGDAAVFGIPNPEFGEEVCAHVTPSRAEDDIDVVDLKARLAMTLSAYKVPRRIVIEAELPREDSGKIFKRRLRDPYWR